MSLLYAKSSMPPLYLFQSSNSFAFHLKPYPTLLILFLWFYFLFISILSNFVLYMNHQDFPLCRHFAHYFYHLECNSLRCSNPVFEAQNTWCVNSASLRNKFKNLIRYVRKKYFAEITVETKDKGEEGKDIQVWNMWRKGRRKEHEAIIESWSTILWKF